MTTSTAHPAPDPEAALLRLTQSNAAAARLLDWMLREHGSGLPWRFSTTEVEAATGLRPSLVLDALATLAGLRLLRLTYHGRDVRLDVRRIGRHLGDPDRPPPSPMFSTEVPPAYREQHKPTGSEGRALLAQHRADDMLANIFNDHLDGVERDLRDIEDVDNLGGPDHDDTD